MNLPQVSSDGRHDFDFVFGRWRLHNRRLTNLLDPDCADWVQFEATGQAHSILGGLGNLDLFSAAGVLPTASRWKPSRCGCSTPRPAGGGSGGPPPADPDSWIPRWRAASATGMAGSSEDVVGGHRVKVRYIWKDITGRSARFEQAFSHDHGESWQTNWIITMTAHA
jgi:hypothetical protein